MGRANKHNKLSRRDFIFSSSCALCFLAMPFKKALAGVPSIRGSRVGVYDGKTRFVLDLSQEVQHKLFILDNPDRIVVDLPYMEWGLKEALGDGLIKKYRFGRFNKDTSRLVFDLTGPASVQNVFTLPADNTKGPRLVIDLASSIKKAVPITETAIANEIKGGMPKVMKEKPAFAEITNQPKKIITLDAGHGGQDPGAIGVGGVYEKDLTLAAAKEAKKLLEASGKYEVHLTRKSDYFLKLWTRVDIARKNKSDLFISIHADSLDDKNVKGASIYTLAEKASDARAAQLAAKENKADLLFDENLNDQPKEVANILLDLKRRETLNSSKILANRVISEMRRKDVNLLNKNHRYAAFAVLKAPDVPSILIEMGFLSNKHEVKLLKSSAYRQRICQSIVDGVEEHFSA